MSRHLTIIQAVHTEPVALYAFPIASVYGTSKTKGIGGTTHVVALSKMVAASTHRICTESLFNHMGKSK